jgi:hypothetical protein
MSNYSRYSTEPKDRKELRKIHPVWRGIGCVLIVLIPGVSYIIGSLLVDARDKYPWVIIPPDIILKQYSDPFIFVRLIYAGVITFILFVIIAIVTFLITAIFGPPRYGPYDVKP